MKVVLIVAACKENLGIGKNNDLLWHLPADMKFFKETTIGYPIITGRKNYESIPLNYRPLVGRENIVVTRDDNYKSEGAYICSDILQAIDKAATFGKEICYVIGGGQIYEQFFLLNLVDEVLITWVDAVLDADTFLKGFSPGDWTGESIFVQEKDAKNSFNFNIVKYTRKFVS